MSVSIGFRFLVGIVVLPSTLLAVSAGERIDRILKSANRHHEISEVVRDLSLPHGLLVGAPISISLQSSQGKWSNPRLLLLDGPLILAFLLQGNSLEVGIAEQIATVDLPQWLPHASGKLSQEEGEILVDIEPFPRTGRFTGEESLNQWNPAATTHDTKRCTACHVDVATTKAAFGQLPLQVGGERLLALVNPFFGKRRPTEVLAVPGDLKLLYQCQCGSALAQKKSSACGRFDALDEESCRRLKVVLDLDPVQDPRYLPAEN